MRTWVSMGKTASAQWLFSSAAASSSACTRAYLTCQKKELVDKDGRGRMKRFFRISYLAFPAGASGPVVVGRIGLAHGLVVGGRPDVSRSDGIGLGK